MNCAAWAPSHASQRLERRHGEWQRTGRLKNVVFRTINDISSLSSGMHHDIVSNDPPDNARATGQARIQLVCLNIRHPVGIFRRTGHSRGTDGRGRCCCRSPRLFRPSGLSDCGFATVRDEKRLLRTPWQRLGVPAIARPRIPLGSIGMYQEYDNRSPYFPARSMQWIKKRCVRVAGVKDNDTEGLAGTSVITGHLHVRRLHHCLTLSDGDGRHVFHL